MRKNSLLIFISFLLIYCNISAQQSSKNDLQKQIQSLPDDTSKVMALVNYAVILENENLDSSAYYYKKAGELSNQLNYYFGKIRYAMNYSVVLNMQSKLNESKELNQWILSLAKKKNDSLHIAKGHNNLANSFNLMANYDSAFFHYLKSCEIFEKIHNEQYLNIIYMNMASVLDNLGQYDRAIIYDRKAIGLSKKLKDSLQLSNIMINMASSFSSKKQFDSTIAILKIALPICELIGNNYSLTVGYITQGNAYNKTNQYQKAIESFNKSLNISQKINYASGLALAYSSLALSYFYLEDFSIAEKYADQALRLIEKNQTLELLQLYKLSADIKAHQGNFPLAYDYLTKFVSLNDSITGMSTRKLVTELEQKYQAAEKDKELLQKQLVIEESNDALKQKNTWLLIAATIIFFSSAIAVNYYRFNKQKQKLHAKELLSMKQQQELERIKASMEGQQQERKRIASEMHDDLGSGLTSILFLAEGTINNVHKSPENIPKIAGVARSVMDKMNEIIWSMNTEYDSLEDLIAYIRHHSVELLTQIDLPYQFSIPDNIPGVNISGTHRRNIHLVVKEALHNIIKHANASLVEIRFSCNENLAIEIADNGKGMDIEALNRFGNGLQNMRRRMETIGGTWNINNVNGTNIQITLPIV